MKKALIAVALLLVMYGCVRLYCNAIDDQYTADQIAALDAAQYCTPEDNQ